MDMMPAQNLLVLPICYLGLLGTRYSSTITHDIPKAVFWIVSSIILQQSHYQAENGTADSIQGPVAPWLHVTGIEQCRCSTGLSGCRSVAAAACPAEEVHKRAANAASFGPEARL